MATKKIKQAFHRTSTPKEKGGQPLKVVIVGAGLAGMCAAHLLTQSGVNVEVFEALDRVGGRTYAIDGVDQGGTFLGPQKKRTIYLAEKLGVKQINLNKDGLYTFFLDGKVYRTKIALPFGALAVDDLLALLWALGNIMVKTSEINLDEPWKSDNALEWDKKTVQDYFNDLIFTEVSRELFQIVVEVLVGVEPWEMSMLYFLWYIKSGHGIIDILTDAQDSILEGGAQQLSQKLAVLVQSASPRNKVITNDPTLSIHKDNDKVFLRQQSGLTSQGNYVIVATTPSVRNQIEFKNVGYNGLYMQYAQRMPMGSILKTFMYYKTRWWHDNGFNGIATMSGAANFVGQVFDISQQTPIPCLMGFVLGDKAREWQTLSKDAKTNILKREYEIFEGDGPANLDFVEYKEYDWLDVSYIGGTGGVAGPGTTTTFHQAICTPIDDARIYFAGTETATDWTGYMDGAIQSGWNAAKEILKKENIPYDDPEKHIKQSTTFFDELQALIVYIIKEILKIFGSKGKKDLKSLSGSESVEEIFQSMLHALGLNVDSELQNLLNEDPTGVHHLLLAFEERTSKIETPTSIQSVKHLMTTKFKNLEGMATHEIADAVHYIGSHLKFEDIIPRKVPQIKEITIEDELKHIRFQNGIYYPDYIDQVVDLVMYSRKYKKIARCRGSGHSPPESIFAPNGIDMVLSGDLRTVSLVEELPLNRAVFKVGGGCYIGVNRLDPTSTRENSLSYQISQLGYAISITGGISEQSIAGFMLTGSSGGSVKFGFPESIREIQFVNGKGEIKTVSPTVEKDLFYAVGVSMGLFGIVISVTIEVVPYFNVVGEETNVMYANSSLQPHKFIHYLKDQEYYHSQWLPQKGVNRVDEFFGKKTQSTKIKKYHHEVGSLKVGIEAAIALKITNEILTRSDPVKPWEETVIAFLLKQFLPIPYKETFLDYWYIALPNDDLAPIDTLLKVDFLEMWFPIDFADELIATLQQKVFPYPKKAGNITTEFYASKESPFWLSMSYGRNCVRLDKLRWAYDIGPPRDFYKYYWDVLMAKPGARFHWGKWMPQNGDVCDGLVFNLDFLKKAYPKMEEWLIFRELMDPDQVFVSDYWRSILEIPRLK
ncbi:hypothetical protein LOD99_13999 [Oopsacas minuta]|uniref:Amine oxidase n=1 Tax=Oopsacas minuta TaxID=111878 RepID=A0AAV7KHR6_9METZ|nr:hypothetical protein LOD99_13999 [Oopsacas minuta]